MQDVFGPHLLQYKSPHRLHRPIASFEHNFEHLLHFDIQRLQNCLSLIVVNDFVLVPQLAHSF